MDTSEADQNARAPSVPRGLRAECVLPLRRTWQGLREELAKETEAKDQSGSLNNSTGDKLQLSGHMCVHNLL